MKLTFFAAALAVTSAAAMRITGLTMPTSFSVDSLGHVWISEKDGVIKVANNVSSTGATTSLDMTARVAPNGDHGLTSVMARNGFLYVTYQALNATFGPGMVNCTDDGTVGGRNASAVRGCPTHGILSRFPLIGADNLTLGAEEIMWNSSYRACAQFGTGGIDYAAFSPSGELFVSVGAGGDAKSDAIPDIGQYGENPCGVPGSTWGGHLRAQDPGSYDGKIMVVSTVYPFNSTVYASGFFNPWRFAWTGTDSLFVIDTGLLDYEEINGPVTQGANYGFPCTQANVSIPAFNAPALNPPPPACAAIAANRTSSAPAWFLHHPTSPAVFSAFGFQPLNNNVNATDGRFYFGDIMNQAIVSIASNASSALPAATWGLKTEAVDVFPVHISFLEDTGNGRPGMVYVDVVTGSILSQDLWPAPAASPSPSPAAPVSGAQGKMGMGGSGGVLSLAMAVTAAAIVTMSRI